MLRVETEHIYRSRLALNVPILEHYREGRASWVFNVQPSHKIDVMGERVFGSPSGTLMEPLFILHVNVANGGVMNHWDQQPVFVSNVEFVNGPDGKIPSVVRLYVGHEEVEELGDGDIYLQVPQGGFKIVRGGVNRELAPSPVAGGNQSRHSFKPNMVKRTLKIVDGVSDNYWETVEQLSNPRRLQNRI